MFYMELVQAVLLFGSKSCVLSAAMSRAVEGTHTEFLQKITGKKELQKSYGVCMTQEVAVVIEAVEM